MTTWKAVIELKHLCISLVILLTLASAGMSQSALAEGKGLNLLWVKEGLENPLASVSDDGSVLIADGRQLYKLIGSGQQAWDIRLDADAEFLEADAKGGCWVAFAKGVARVLPSGKVSWTYSCDEGIRCLEPLPDGRVLVGTDLGGLLLDEDGKFVWLYDPATGCDT